MLVNVPKLTAYYTDVPDSEVAAQRVAFGTSGHRGSPLEKALSAGMTHRHDYLTTYISDLVNVIDMDSIRPAKISLGVDPLGGAGVHYWGPIAERASSSKPRRLSALLWRRADHTVRRHGHD